MPARCTKAAPVIVWHPLMSKLLIPARGTKAAFVMVGWLHSLMFRLWMPVRGAKAASVMVGWLHLLMFRL